jgi:hypothetical protein
LNIVLRDKGFEEEEELVLWEEEEEFIRCCCATAVDGSVSPFNAIIINPTTAMAVASANSFLIGLCWGLSYQIYFYASSMRIMAENIRKLANHYLSP